MKFLSLFAASTLLFILFLVVPVFADNTNNCVNVQRHNGGSVNNNCNNNSNSQSQSQEQNNNQTVNITNSVVAVAPRAVVLPSTGPMDVVLYSLFASFPLGILLRKKA